METALQLFQWYKSVGISRDMWEEVVQKNMEAKATHEQVKETIANRREMLCWFSKDSGVDPKSMSHTLRLHHPEWRQVYEEDKEARKDISALGATNIELVMDHVKETAIVPEKEANG